MQTLLNGGVPDVPPHWELVYQIGKETFGLHPGQVDQQTWPDAVAKGRARMDIHNEISLRLIEEREWAVALPPNPYDPATVAYARQKLGSRVLVPGFEGSGIFNTFNWQQIMEFVEKLCDRPAELHAEARAKCDQAKQAFRRLVDAGADFLVGTYDCGFNDGPFISPDHFAEFVTPYLTELVQEAHDLKRVLIMHSDGCLTRILDQIHSTGVDGYHSVDPQGHMDIKTVREQYPDWLLMGNVACNLLQDTDEARIRESVRYCMTHGGVGKRYIFSTSNCIFPGMPPRSYDIMLDEYRQMCGAARRPAGAG
jgi:uroporphyrinogen decarboxylase